MHQKVTLSNVGGWIVDTIQWKPFKVHKPEVLYSHQANNTFVLIVSLIDEKTLIYQNAIKIIDKTILLLDKELSIKIE